MDPSKKVHPRVHSKKNSKKGGKEENFILKNMNAREREKFLEEAK